MGYVEGQDAVLLADQAAVREGVATAYSATAAAQREAAAFMVEHGADVLPGHADVGQPGRMGDPDAGLPDAADL